MASSAWDRLLGDCVRTTSQRDIDAYHACDDAHPAQLREGVFFE